MHRITPLALGRFRFALPRLTHSAEDVKTCGMNLAKSSYNHTVELKHLLLALYMRQPGMIGDFTGNAGLSELSKKLLGYEVIENDCLYTRQSFDRPHVYISDEVNEVFRKAEKIAGYLGRSYIGSAEIFLSLLLTVNKDQKIKDLITEHGIDKNKILRAYVECNADKYREPLDLKEIVLRN